MPAPHKILIADDEPEIVLLVRRLLEAFGYETCAAYEGVRAVEMAVKQAPDLILLDVMMPAGNGLRVLEALKAQPKTREIPVIVMTASAEPGLEAEVRNKGARDFLAKPFENNDLIAKVRAFLPK